MVRKKVSSEAADPTLSHGWAIFCEVGKYYSHLAKYGDQPEEVNDLIVFMLNGLRSSIFTLALHVCQTSCSQGR